MAKQTRIVAAVGVAVGRGGAGAAASVTLTGRQVENHAKGVALGENARIGHEIVHGTAEQKRARWKQQADDYHKEVAAGTARDAAYYVVAERHGVSDRTIRRAVERMK